MSTPSNDRNNIKIFILLFIGVFSVFAFFVIVLFKMSRNVEKERDPEDWVRILAMVVIGSMLFFLIILA